jgi:hypothetical protein
MVQLRCEGLDVRVGLASMVTPRPRRRPRGAVWRQPDPTAQPARRSTRWAGIAIVGLAVACGTSPGPGPDPRTPTSVGQWVSVPEGTRLKRLDFGGDFPTPAPALFQLLPSPPLELRRGATDEDRRALEEHRARLLVVALPFGRYWVQRDLVTMVNTQPRAASDRDAVLLYASVQDAVGAALAELECRSGRDMISHIAEEAIAPDRAALRVLESAGVDPASYPAVERIGKPRYTRPPDWGRPAAGTC